MEEIPTVEEFLKVYYFGVLPTTSKEIENVMAELHIRLALQYVAANAEIEDEGNLGPMGWEELYVVDENSILDAYPIENIK